VELVKIYVDEDAMDSDLVTALRSRGVTVITALDAGLIEKPDDRYGTRRGRAYSASA
jgi:hypothetical protein